MGRGGRSNLKNDIVTYSYCPVPTHRSMDASVLRLHQGGKPWAGVRMLAEKYVASFWFPFQANKKVPSKRTPPHPGGNRQDTASCGFSADHVVTCVIRASLGMLAAHRGKIKAKFEFTSARSHRRFTTGYNKQQQLPTQKLTSTRQWLTT